MNGGPSTGGAPVGGAAPNYQGKKLKSIGQGIAPSGKKSGRGRSKAKVRKVTAQPQVKAVMPGKRRSG